MLPVHTEIWKALIERKVQEQEEDRKELKWIYPWDLDISLSWKKTELPKMFILLSLCLWRADIRTASHKCTESCLVWRSVTLTLLPTFLKACLLLFLCLKSCWRRVRRSNESGKGLFPCAKEWGKEKLVDQSLGKMFKCPSSHSLIKSSDVQGTVT